MQIPSTQKVPVSHSTLVTQAAPASPIGQVSTAPPVPVPVPLPVPLLWEGTQIVPLQVRPLLGQQATSVQESPFMWHPEPVVVPEPFTPPVPVPLLVVPLLLVPQAIANATTASKAPRRPNEIKLFISSLRFREADFRGHSF